MMKLSNYEVDCLAQIIWDYHHVNHRLEKADCLLVLGNHDMRVTDYGINLFFEGWSSWIMFSGGAILNRPELNVVWDRPEAEIFAARAIERGIPEDKILIEKMSKNTGENFEFSRNVLEQKGLIFHKFIVVQKPYMERRTWATGKKRWPNKEFIITSPPVSYEEYVRGPVPREQIIHIMVGDLQRIKVYGEKGWQIPQDIPADVWEAFLKLKEAGYRSRLVED